MESADHRCLIEKILRFLANLFCAATHLLSGLTQAQRRARSDKMPSKESGKLFQTKKNKIGRVYDFIF